MRQGVIEKRDWWNSDIMLDNETTISELDQGKANWYLEITVIDSVQSFQDMYWIGI